MSLLKCGFKLLPCLAEIFMLTVNTICSAASTYLDDDDDDAAFAHLVVLLG